MDATIMLEGRLTGDPELRYTQTGKAVCTLSVAVNGKRGDDEHVTFYRCTVWEQQAENCAESLVKGTLVTVSGLLRQETYRGRDGGERQSLEVNVRSIGPSLAWATAQVARSGGNGSGPPVQRPAGRGRPDAGGGFDEEPF